MKRRILSTALALVMCLSLLPSTAFAAEEEPQIDWLIELDEGAHLVDADPEENWIVVEKMDGDFAQFALFDMDGKCLVDYGTYSVMWSTGMESYIHFFENGYTMVLEDGKCSLIDTTGKLVAPFKYNYDMDFAYDLSEGLIMVREGEYPNEKYGFIDMSGNLVVPAKYDDVEDFHGGLARVRKDGKWGVVDTTGELVIPCEYDNVEYCYEGLAAVYKDGKGGFVDTNGELVIPCEYDSVGYFSEGLASVEKNGKEGVIDKSGKVVIDYAYDSVSGFSEGLAWVRKGMKEGVIDKSGNVVIPIEYDYTYYTYGFSEGLAWVSKDGKWGAIDKSGKVVIPFQYSNPAIGYIFSDGLASVRKDGKYGAIDKSGNVVIPIEYDYVESFSEGLVLVFKDEKYGLIDTSGKVVIPCEYDYIRSPFSDTASLNGMMTVVEKGFYEDAKVGLFENTGKIILDSEYDAIADLRRGNSTRAVVEKDGKIGIAHLTNVSTYTVTFDSDGDSDIAAQTVAVGEKVAKPTDPTKAGHTFDGWYDENGKKWDFDTDIVKGNITLHAEWKVKTYTVTFDSDGGSSVASQSVAWSEKVTKPADPTKVKHVFDGWYDENDGKWNFSTPITEDITLYAKWVEKDYTVSFNSNGGSSVASQYADDGEKLTKPTDPTKDGNTFGGWYRDTVFEKVEDTVYTLEVDTENLFNDVYKWNFDTDVVMGDFTLHAKWTASQNDNDDNQNNDQNNNTNTDNGGGGNGGYTGPVVIPGKQPEKPKPEEPKDETPSVTFSDVPADAYYADAVAWAVEKGITNGVGGDSFAPEASCTRGQMVTFLWRMAGCPTVSGGASFSDVTTDSYYADAIAWAVANGITNGMGDGTFAPDAECTRAQMATFLYRMQGGTASGESGFADVETGAYYADAVAWAAANGITTGTGDGLFSPNANCTRGQMVTFLFRCFAE